MTSEVASEEEAALEEVISKEILEVVEEVITDKDLTLQMVEILITEEMTTTTTEMIPTNPPPEVEEASAETVMIESLLVMVVLLISFNISYSHIIYKY